MEQPTIDLDVNDVLEDVAVEPTTEEESSTPETEATESEESQDETESNEEDSPEAEETTDEPEFKGAEARKEQVNTEIRDLVSKRNELRAEVEWANSQLYRAQTPEELMEEGIDPAMARIDAMEQRAQIAEYNTQVSNLNFQLETESLQVKAEMPVFDPMSPNFDATFAAKVSQAYQRVAAIQTDPTTGYITNANVTPYQFYKDFADTYALSQQAGQIKGQKAADRQLASADVMPSSAPKAEKQDDFLAGMLKGYEGKL